MMDESYTEHYEASPAPSFPLVVMSFSSVWKQQVEGLS